MIQALALAALFLITGHQAIAEEKDQLKALHAKIGAISELSSDFTQTVYRNTRKRKSESQGKAYFAAPNRFRWILQTPDQEEIRFDGKNLLIVKLNEKVATRYAGMAAQTKEIEQIVSMVLDLKSLTARFDLKSIEKKQDTHHLIFAPKSSESDLREIEIDVAEPKFLVNRVKMSYVVNYTEIVFSNQTKSVPAGLIDEKLPSDIKIKDLK